MGKAALIIVAAGMLATAIMMRSATIMAFETEGQNSAYEGEFIAREIARSAMNTAVAQARRNFDEAETIAYDDVAHRNGTFDVTSERLSPSSVVLEATGNYDTFEYRIKTTLTQSSAFDAALNIQAGEVDGAFNGNSFDVAGNDTNPPSDPDGGASSGNDKHAIQARTDSGRDTMLDELALNQHDNVRGVDGNADVAAGAFSIDLFALHAEAMGEVDQTVTDNTINGNTTFGSPNLPVIVHVTSDVRINGSAKGYGMLIVDGDLDVSGNFTWEGIVVAKDDDSITWSGTGNSKVYGAVVLIGREEGEDDDEGDAEVSISGNSKIMYSSVAINRLADRLTTVADAAQIVVADQWSGSAE